MERQGSPQRHSNDLIQGGALGFIGPPKRQRVRHLRNEDALDKHGDGAWIRRVVSAADPGDQAGGGPGLGRDGGELSMPPAIRLELQT